MRICSFLFTLGCCVCLLGCGEGGSRVPVTGTVTYDNNPVDNGRIILTTHGSKGSESTSAEIRDGKFAFNAEKGPSSGKYKVEIYWEKKTGKQVPTPGDPDVKIDEVKQMLPPKYNVKSELEANIKASEPRLEFALKK